MRRLASVVLGSLLLPVPMTAAAQEPPLTFQAALDLAAAQNLDLAAARRG